MLPYKTKDQEVAGRIMATPGTMATVSHAIALHFFGTDIYEWEPETLAMELTDTLDVKIDEENLDRLHSIISSITSNSFYKDWVAFTAVCSVLNNENDPDELAEMTVAEFTWGIIEVSLNDDDVNEYIRDQSVLLFKQIKMLPWISEDQLEDIVNNLSSEINSVANKKRNDPLYGNNL